MADKNVCGSCWYFGKAETEYNINFGNCTHPISGILKKASHEGEAESILKEMGALDEDGEVKYSHFNGDKSNACDNYKEKYSQINNN
jgi:hypothetical protein